MAKKKRDIYQEVTNRILELLDRGTAPWRQPIKRRGGGGMPISLSTKKPYRGINVFLLGITAHLDGFASEYWLTFNQAKKQGGKIRKGEKGTLVVFWKQYATKDKQSGEEITLPVLRHYNLFNADQVDGIEAPDALPPEEDATPFVPIDEAEKIVAGYRNGPEIKHCGTRASYLPRVDRIEIAAPEKFESRESYYATLFHELTHSVGHSKRLDRKIDEQLSPFGSPDYSKEELVAEMGSAFLAAVAGISPPTIDQSAAYIDGWRQKLKADKKLVVQAAGLGQRSADHILGITFDADGNRQQQGARPAANTPAAER